MADLLRNPSYTTLRDATIRFSGSSQLAVALVSAGCDGFPVSWTG